MAMRHHASPAVVCWRIAISSLRTVPRRKRRKNKAMPQCGGMRDLCPALVKSRKPTTGTKGEALCRIEY